MAAPSVRELLDLTGRVALVTGASQGIGRGIALRFAEAGAKVVVHYRRDEAGARAVCEVIRAEGGDAIIVGAELTEPAGAKAVVDEALRAFGRLDVAVNNAGSYPVEPLLELTEAAWDGVVGANLKSAFLVTQAAARLMIARGGTEARGLLDAGRDVGAIVNVTSIEASDPAPGHAHYDAAKAGLLMLTKSSALELGRHGIRVNAVAPGLIHKDGLEAAWPDGVRRYLDAAPLGRLGAPSDVADACLFLASPAARWITGASLTVDGGVCSTQSF